MLLDFDNVVDGLVIVGAKNHWKKYGQTRETNNELISCAAASKSGNLEVLQWARENGMSMGRSYLCVSRR